MSGEKLTLEDLAQIVARRQKRLAYWREQFLIPGTLSGNEMSLLEENFKTYQLLITRLIKAHQNLKSGSGESENLKAEDLNGVESRLAAFDRVFNDTFAARRLLTSKIGTPAVNS